MNEFISVYDLLVGHHKDKCPGIKELATAIEVGGEGVELFHFDRVGRYKKVAESREREAILVAIAEHHDQMSVCEPYDVEEYLINFEDYYEGNLTRIYGWSSELPDFEAIYAAWKAENGYGEEEDPDLPKFVRPNNKAWDVLLGSVMFCISSLPASYSKELGRNKTVHELVDDIISRDSRSQQTQPLLSLLNRQGVQITDTTLLNVVRAVPEKVLKSFR